MTLSKINPDFQLLYFLLENKYDYVDHENHAFFHQLSKQKFKYRLEHHTNLRVIGRYTRMYEFDEKHGSNTFSNPTNVY